MIGNSSQESVARTEEKVMKKVAPVEQGGIQFISIVGLTNDCKVLLSGEDMYGNEAEFSDKIVSSIDLATLGYAKGILKVGGKNIRLCEENKFPYN